ncbi:hypothetical protein LRR80_05420 [Streptomyces sp. RO-S4]|uniref:hypothetical protein n=1 Tax=Streptomyces sp. RO-S4 TaxID=2902486 RepID=UPI00208EFA7E|nr:hypothetical protein [Streptomyces sp. RO-S4]MCO4699326.1 hypothetical protein [Streptomyces sp. RO-S4]
MTPKRYTASTITDDALDALYDNANRGWRRGDEWKQRALAAEAAVERVQQACHELPYAHARRILAALAQHEENSSK